jgi:Ca2+-dependent lipid-binding protein
MASCRYNTDFHVVVTAVSGIGLKKTDMFGSPDPFVKITIAGESFSVFSNQWRRLPTMNSATDPAPCHHNTEGESFSSKPMKKTLSPVWNQPFHFKKVPLGYVSKL